MSFRKEKKFRLTKAERILLENSLIKRGMEFLYPSRKINSCYFDNRNLQTFYDSDEGILPRKKFRIRWYNDSLNLTKEIKISSIEGRFKLIRSFYDKNFFDSYDTHFFDQEYGLLSPTMIVTYIRSYYQYDLLRITFDSNIQYLDLRNSVQRLYHDQENVMEIKTGIEISDDYIESLVCHSTCRFSKYARGILLSERLL